MDAAHSRPYAVPALEKGLDVLELLAARPAAPSLADLARELGRSASEIFRTLVCLERRGFVAREEGSGRYRLTLKLFELAHTHSPVEALLRAADRPMRDLARETGESCHLSVLSQGKLVVLAQAESPRMARFSVEVGGRFPPVRTCSGRLLLAHLPKELLHELLARDADYRRLGPAGRKQFLSRLLEIRRSGVSTAESETHVGIRDVAVLVGNPRVGVAGALCAPALTPSRGGISTGRLRQALERCARQITRALGLRVI